MRWFTRSHPGYVYRYPNLPTCALVSKNGLTDGFERPTDRKRERAIPPPAGSLTCVSETMRAGPGHSQGQRAPWRSPTWEAGAQVLGPSSAASRRTHKQLDWKHRVARVRIRPSAKGAGVPRDSLAGCTPTRTPNWLMVTPPWSMFKIIL